MIPVTNMLVPVRDTPAAPAPPAEVSIPPVPVKLLILGAMVLALAPQLTNTLALVQATQEAPENPATASITNAPALVVMSGKMAVVNNN